MEKRDAIFLLLLLGGSGYAIYANWDTISSKLGLAEYDPGRIKAVELAKDAITFQSGAHNWQYMRTRERRGEIVVAADPWVAEPTNGQEYSVVVRWLENDVPVAHAFRVDIATRTVVHQGLLEEPAMPR